LSEKKPPERKGLFTEGIKKGLSHRLFSGASGGFTKNFSPKLSNLFPKNKTQ